jgi:hypothetical protein
MKSQFRAQPCITPIAVSVPLELSAIDDQLGLPGLRDDVEASREDIEQLARADRESYAEHQALVLRVEALEKGGTPPAPPQPQETQVVLEQGVVLTGRLAAWLDRAGLDWCRLVEVTKEGTQPDPLVEVLTKHAEGNDIKDVKPAAELVLQAMHVALRTGALFEDTAPSSKPAARQAPAPRSTRARKS